MRLSFEYGTKVIEFDVEYRRRKTLEISVEAPNRVFVVAPLGLSNEKVIEKVKSKANWIVKKIFELSQIEHRPIKREFVNGESFMYLGRNHSLQIIYDNGVKKPEVKLYHGRFYVTTNTKDEEAIKLAMEDWYRMKTKEKVEERIKYYQRYFDKKPKAIIVKDQKKRWASCTYDNRLLFNWRCSMARADALDYIIVHEMCHMYHKNHSKDFWNLVASILPDYKNRQDWLKKYGVKMDL